VKERLDGRRELGLQGRVLRSAVVSVRIVCHKASYSRLSNHFCGCAVLQAVNPGPGYQLAMVPKAYEALNGLRKDLCSRNLR
jgi:hypothetical protein